MRAQVRFARCVYPVKLKNLKANHNGFTDKEIATEVVYIP